MLGWLLWRLPMWYEKHHRQGGGDIPFYSTGDIGNPVGFSLVVFAFSFYYDVRLVVVMIPIAVFVTLILRSIWIKQAGNNPAVISGYTPTGVTTLGGRLHELYVGSMVIVIGVGCIGVLLDPALNQYSLSLMSGLGIYAVTVVIDRCRGVI